LIGSPAGASDSSFPSGVTNITFGFSPAAKPYNVETGGKPNLNNSTMTPIAGIGAGGEVTQVTTLYMRTASPMKVQLTLVDPDGGSDLVSTVPINGVHLMEFPSNGYLKGLSVKGSGQFEFWASGNQ
jgi:hypothetical protein